jgi:hypothetical protein
MKKNTIRLGTLHSEHLLTNAIVTLAKNVMQKVASIITVHVTTPRGRADLFQSIRWPKSTISSRLIKMRGTIL